LLVSLHDNQGVAIHSLVENLSKEVDKGEERWGWLARRLVQEELIRESNDGSQKLFLCESGRYFLKEPWPLKYAG